MTASLDGCLVVAISSRALFDLSEENKIYETLGLEAYETYQREHEQDILKKGSGFALIESLLMLNELEPKRQRVEVVIMSRNNADTSLRIFRTIAHYGLDITRAAFTSGNHLSSYLEAFEVDLFLSAHSEDVLTALQSGFAAGLIYTNEGKSYPEYGSLPIRIAFDGDAVLFSDEAELIYQKDGLEAFVKHEVENANKPLPKGPFAKLLKTLSTLQQEFEEGAVPIQTALVTARNAPAHERVIQTLRVWNVKVDQAFFLGGLSKKPILQALQPQIFFDDQSMHALPASSVIPSAQVPYQNR